MVFTRKHALAASVALLALAGCYRAFNLRQFPNNEALYTAGLQQLQLKKWDNAVLIFGFAHAAWFTLARALPPVASSLSVMMIPVLGVFSGALGLGEVLHWQDWTAVALMVVAIASVLMPGRSSEAEKAG